VPIYEFRLPAGVRNHLRGDPAPMETADTTWIALGCGSKDLDKQFFRFSSRGKRRDGSPSAAGSCGGSGFSWSVTFRAPGRDPFRSNLKHHDGGRKTRLVGEAHVESRGTPKGRRRARAPMRSAGV